MSQDQTPHTADLLRNLHAYQKDKTSKLLRVTRYIASIFSLLAIGLGILWYLNGSWVALVFAIIFIAIGLGIFGITFFIADKIDTFNTVASTAMDFYDMTKKSDTINANDQSTSEKTAAPVKQIER